MHLALAGQVPFALAGGQDVFGSPHGNFNANIFGKMFVAVDQHAPSRRTAVDAFFFGIEADLDFMFTKCHRGFVYDD